MFDAVLTGGNVPKRRLGAGMMVSIVTHIGLGALVAWITLTPVLTKTVEADVKFMAAPPPPPPPPPPPAARPKVDKKPTAVRKPDTFVETKDKTEEKPKDPEPTT